MRRNGRILQSDENTVDRKSILSLAAAILLLVFSIGLTVHTFGRTRAAEVDSQEFRQRLESLQCQLQQIRKPMSMRVKVTTYQSEPRQTDSTPHITSINRPCRPGIIAVSRDLLEAGWAYGKKVYIEGYGVYTIQDVMNARHSRSIDIWIPEKARPFSGKNVLAVLVEG